MELFEHQVEVVDKFRNIRSRLVGDSMGVGKTAEGIGLDLDLRKHHAAPGSHVRTLILCTKNGLQVWNRHLIEFGVNPKRILVINPKDRGPFEKELRLGAKRYDYYICHWDVLAKLEDINAGTAAKPHILWDHVIADEVHLAKNKDARRTKELKKLKCRVKTGLSGTPADNKPHDLWSVLNWLYPKHYTSYWRFFNQYIEWNDWSGYRTITGVKNLDKLHAEIAPFYIRRTLKDVREDMPEKIYTTVEVELTPKQRKTYEEMEEFHLSRLGDDEDELIAPIAVAVYQRMQQMTLGTVEIDWETYQVKFEKYERDWAVWHALGEPEGKEPKKPSMPLFIKDPSPKIDAVMEIIEAAQEEGESVVVFTNYTEAANLVESRCQSKKIGVSKITGAVTNQTSRDMAVQSFQTGVNPVFVGTIGAAGTTITLNRAHTVIFVDRNWNPSKNAQAEDRPYRIDNDTQNIQIIDIVAKDTIDQERLDRIGTKMKWLKAILGG